MSRIGGIKAGRAFVEIGGNAGPLERELKRASASLSRFSSQVGQIGRQLASRGGFGVVGFAATVKAAGNAAESLSRFRQVFGDQAEAAGAFADALAGSVGRSGLAIREQLGTFQSFFRGLGFGAVQSRELSQQLSGLALDFASFNNLSDAEGQERFIAALSGSAEVLEKFGINLKQAALGQELLNRGIDPSKATEQEKALARIELITRALGTQGATGDAARTLGSLNNQLKRLGSFARDASVAIGDSLLPAVTPVVSAVGDGVQRFAAFAKENRALVAAVAGAAVGITTAGIAIAGLGLAISGAGVLVGALAGGVGLLGAAAAAVASPIGIAIGAVVALGAVLSTQTEIGRQAIDFLRERFGFLANDAADVVRFIADAFQGGNISNAAAGAWSRVLASFLSVRASLRDAFTGLLADLLDGLLDFGDNVQQVVAGIAANAARAAGNTAANIIQGVGGLAGVDLSGVAGVALGASNVAGSTIDAISGQAAAGFGDIRASVESIRSSANEQSQLDRATAETIRNAGSAIVGLGGFASRIQSGGADVFAGFNPLEAAAKAAGTSVAGVTDIGALRTISASGPEERTARAAANILDEAQQIKAIMTTLAGVRFV